MSAAHREWQLDLAKNDLRDFAVEAACERRVAEHRERRKIGPGGKLEYQEIDVSQNSITWQGCKAVLGVCLQCLDLRVVKLFKNELTDLAAPSLCRLVEECRGLEQLHLTYNLLTAVGAKDIIEAAHRGRTARLQANAKARKKPGFTLWLRLEHNKISNSVGLLEELRTSGIDFCEAKDTAKCGPRHCKHFAALHLPYFTKQDAEICEGKLAAQVPPTKSPVAAKEKRSPRPPPPAIPPLPPALNLQEQTAEARKSGDEDESEGCASSESSLEVVDIPTTASKSGTVATSQSCTTTAATNASRLVGEASYHATSEEMAAIAPDAPEGAKSEAPSGTSEPPELLATSDPYALDIELDAEEFEAPDIIAALKTPAAIDPEVLEPVKATEEESDVEAELEGDFNIASPVDDAPVQTPDETKANNAPGAKLVGESGSGLTAEEKAFEASVKNLAEAASRRKSTTRSRSRDTGSKRLADGQAGEDESHHRKHEKKTKKEKQDKGDKKRKPSPDGSAGSEGRASKKHRKHKREGERETKDVRNSKDEREGARPSGSPPQAHPKGHAAAILAMRPVQLSKKTGQTKEQAAAEVKEAFGLDDEEDVNEKDPKDQKDQKDGKDAKESKETPKFGRAASPEKSKHNKHKKESKEQKDKESKKSSKEGKDLKEASITADAMKRKTKSEEKTKAAAEEKPKAATDEKPKAAAKGLAGLGNIAELQKQIADERAKMRLFVIKAKQEWEERRERGKARGETNEQEYYIASEGEAFGPSSEFRVVQSIGRGVFSSVYECKNTKEGDKSYAVKFVRSNHMMKKAAEKEVELYRRLAKVSPKEDAEASQFLMFLSGPESFIHQGHLAMIFELQKCDLRTAMQKYGQGKGLPLQTVAQYVKQIFLGLRVLRKMKIIHGDLKPDNILMSLSKTEVKVCDFGSAMDVSTAEEVKTAYAQPRYYRAPEIIIGVGYDTQIDLWSAGVTLFELCTGKILFTGRTNNAMLRAMLDTCGEFPKRMTKEGLYVSKHFNANGDLVHKDPDSMTGLPEVLQMRKFQRPPKPVTSLVEKVLKEPPPNADNKTQERLLPRLADLVSKCIRIDQAERITPDLALQHNFFKKGG